MSGPITGEPRLAAAASWAVLAASFGLSASTWIALARLAGFTDTVTVFGIVVALAWLMPIAVDGYVVVALVLWMAPVPAPVAAFARINTYAAAGIGVAAQSAYHALIIWSTQPVDDRQPWRAVLAAIVGALPPAVSGLAVHMRALIRREGRTTEPGTTEPDTTATPVSTTATPVDVTPAPVGESAANRVPMAERDPASAGTAVNQDSPLTPASPAAVKAALTPPAPITTSAALAAPRSRVNGHAVGSGVAR